MENWKVINDFPNYEISNFGNIRNKTTLLKIVPNKQGYNIVVLCNGGIRKTINVHRLVAAAFVPNPENKPCVDHIDGNRANNHADNLRWSTRKQNANNPISIERYRKAGIIQKPYKQLQIPVQQLKDGFLIGSYSSIREAERATGIAHTSISRVIRGTLNTAGGYKWKYKE